MTLKMSVFFTGPSGGWSETYWIPGTNPATATSEIATFPGANGQLSGWLATRRALLPSLYKIVHVRVSTDPLSRQYEIFEPPGDRQPGTYPTAPGAETFSALLIDWSGGGAPPNILHRKTFLGGLPEDIISPPQDYKANTTWQPLFDAWTGQCRDNSFQIHSRPNPADAMMITDFTTSVDGRQAFILPVDPATTEDSPTTVILRGIKQPHGWNGTHSAVPRKIPPDTGVLTMVVGPTRQALVTVPPWADLKSGTIQVFSGRNQAASTINAERIVEHKRGRPFGQEVGRRRRP